MTLHETTDFSGTGKNEEIGYTSIGIVLRAVILGAMETGRLVIGGYACAELLAEEPETVYLCIMPDVSMETDVSMRIQQKLLEAYCWENNIPVLRVDNLIKLDKVDFQLSACVFGTSACVIIKVPVAYTPEEFLINEYINTQLENRVPLAPLIVLPG